MRLSTRGRYAVMAMAELAARQPPDAGVSCGLQPVSLAEVAQAQGLSLAYLEQLFALLRRAELVASSRGPGGGYRLSRPPAEISIAAVVEAVEEPIRATRCEAASPGCLAGQRCPTHDLWEELGQHIRLFFHHVSLADVVQGRVLGRATAPAAVVDATP